MKKKIILILLIIISILIISAILVFANSSDEEAKLGSFFSNKDIVKINEAYIQEDANIVKELKINDSKVALSVADDYLTKFKLTGSTVNSDVKYFDNILDSTKEVVITNEESIITLNAETEELISYVNQKTSFPKNKLSEEEIKEKAILLFKELDDYNINDYELILLDEFDEEIWMVGFAKKYDNLINIGEQIRISFAPQSGEILTLGINNIKYDNNEVKISEETARKIASQYLIKSVATDMTISIDIIRPNEFLTTNLKKEETYIKPQHMRKAYVCEFNNEDKTQIYVDCTTGEILGGSLQLGGEF